MAKNFRELQAKMSPERQARARAMADEIIRNMPLDELREARKLTQATLANALHVNQAAVSKLERRADMYVSTLRSYVEAMGGHLEVLATFPEGQVRITQFEQKEEEREHAVA
jgi:transcriptional regulator with XRE-family HTH domain